MKKLLSVFLTIILIISVMPAGCFIFKPLEVSAINQVWSGKTATGFAGGSGTAGSPYLIATGEQLALALTSSYCSKSFKLVDDIYLNDIFSDNWQSKTDCNTWLDSHKIMSPFTGTFDGDGYVVYGIYFDYETTPSNTYVGLFPRIGGSAVIKNVGISHAYIKAAIGDGSVYAGGLFGMGSAFYNFYGNKIGPSETENDEFLVPGNTTPTKLPSFTNCFVDHTCYIEANAVGGIGNPGGAVIVVRDCYVTATLVGSDTATGALIGNQWSKGSRIYNSVAFPQNDIKSSAGTQQWVSNKASICYYQENVYYHGTNEIFGTIRVKRPQWRIGEAAKTAMPNLDWQNTWRVEKDGTPVLRVFDKSGRSGAEFSDKQFKIPTSTISFDTGDSGVVVESITGEVYEPVTLPTPVREGYIFTGWYSYEDLTLLYPYDYFLPRDITLYASWESVTLTQDFEDYPYTTWDCDTSLWRYNRIASVADIFTYKSKYVHSGSKSMQLQSGYEEASLLLNYTDTLTAGQEYTISLWVATDASDFSSAQIALAHKIYPDYLAADAVIEFMTDVNGLTVGEWTQYTYTFTARSPWLVLKFMGNDSIYLDNITVAPSAELLTEVTAPDGAETIKEGGYYGSHLKSVTLCDSMINIGEFAFAYSDFLTDIVITENVETINEYAFYKCKALTDVWYTGTEEDAQKIIIAANNDSLKNAQWHYNSCGIGASHCYDNACDTSCNNCQRTRTTSAHIYENGICSVCGATRESVIGDVNKDEAINNRDLAILMQYINKWKVDIDEVAADVNGDLLINNKDYALLMRYINGWDIKLQPQVVTAV